MYNSSKDKVLQATDIVEVIGERVPLTRKGKDFAGLCPFHRDHKPSLQVSPRKQIFKCFACGAGGDALKFVRLFDRLSFADALALLARRAGLNLGTTDADRESEQRREQMHAAMQWACAHFQRNLHQTEGGRAALEYALSRGLTAATIERHGLGYALEPWDDLYAAARRARLADDLLRAAGLIVTSEKGHSYDRFRQRLMFPIFDALGRPIAFGGRTLADDPAKYLNSPETALFSKSRVLFGLNLARTSIEQRREAIVVEGYLDAVLLHQFGFTHAVATLGTALSDAHVKALKRHADQLVLCFDGDAAGIKAADRGLEIAVLGGVDVRVVVLPGGLDPADYVLAHGAAGFEHALRGAVDALEFKWSTLTAASDGRLARRAAVRALLDFVASLLAGGRVDPLEQALLVRRLSERLAMPAESVREVLVAARKRGAAAVRNEPVEVENSAYESAVADLPAGLVAAVEDLLGMLLDQPAGHAWVNGDLAAAVPRCQAWERLYLIMRDLLELQGGYTRADVIARCEDVVLCDLVDRICRRAPAQPGGPEAFDAVRLRLVSELHVQRRAELQPSLRDQAEDPERSAAAFGALLGLARDEHFVLPAESRWMVGS